MRAFPGLYFLVIVTHSSDLIARSVLGSSLDAWFASGAIFLLVAVLIALICAGPTRRPT